MEQLTILQEKELQTFKEAIFTAIELFKNRNEYQELTKNVLQHIPLKLEKGDNKE